MALHPLVRIQYDAKRPQIGGRWRMTQCPFQPQNDGAHMNFSDEMSYTDYLSLDSILNAQAPLSDAHDELLFIIQHQTSELWMKLALHELQAAREAIKTDAFSAAFKMLARVARIFEQLNSAWDVLRTMTPSEYTLFRDDLGQSSGFQSHQYRMIEFITGNRNHAMLKPHAHRPDLTKALENELQRPSLYLEVVRALDRAGFEIAPRVFESDIRQSMQPEKSVEAAWKQIYDSPETYWTLYELAEKLVDFEDYFRRWRFNHATTVERIIGIKRGTGGTSGVGHLKRMLEVELFPELWRMRGAM